MNRETKPSRSSSPLQVVTSTPHQTRSFAQVLVPCLSPGMVIGLSGPLGAGKTEFVRGLAGGCNSQDEVTSPTFVLEHEYRLAECSVTTLYHWDLYRLAGGGEDLELRDQAGDSRGLVVVEWAERVPWVLDLLSLRISLSVDAAPEDRQVRRITIEVSETLEREMAAALLSCLGQACEKWRQSVGDAYSRV